MRLGRLGASLVIACTSLAVLGCAEGSSGSSDLLPPHKDMVDALAADGDCASLQARFDDADANRRRPGSDLAKRNLALMEYADEAMQRIGCYD